MDFDEKRQREIEHDERWLAGVMAGQPADGAAERGRQAVRLAMNERWLEQFSTHHPRPQAIMHVRTAIRTELEAAGLASRYRLFGALSAAAAIALAVGIAWLAIPSPQASSPAPLAAATSPVDDGFVDAWDAVRSEDRLDEIAANVASIGEEIHTLVRTTLPRRDELDLDHLQDRIDWMQTDPTEILGTL